MKNCILLFSVMLSVLTGCKSKEDSSSVRVDLENYITTEFVGHGVQWSAYPHADSENSEWGDLMTDEKWDMNYKRLDFMKPRVVRVIDQANWRYLEGFTESGDPIIEYNNQEVRSLYKLLDYCQKNDIAVMLGEWGAPFQVHDIDSKFHNEIKDARDPRWLKMITDWLKHLVVDKGYTCIKYYNLVNEVNGNWSSIAGDWEEWSEAVLALNENLKAAGLLQYLSIIGPDSVRWHFPNNKINGKDWVYKSIEELDSIMSCYDVHDYPELEFIYSGEFGKYYESLAEAAHKVNKPIIMGELGSFKDTPENIARIKADPYSSTDSQMAVYDFKYGVDMADATIQTMNAGVDGVVAWALDDAMHTLEDLGHSNQLKRWGFWNSLGTEICKNPADENIRPWFYPWSLLCRSFTPDMNIVKTAPLEDRSVRYAVGHNGKELTIAVVNNSDSISSFSLKLDGANFSNVDLNYYSYEEGKYSVDADGFPVVDREMTLKMSNDLDITIAPKSVSIYTTIK